MVFRNRSFLGALALVCSLTSVVSAAPTNAPHGAPGAADAPSTVNSSAIHVDSVSVPATVSSRTRVALRDAIARHLSETQLGATSSPYSVSVSLQQMRRYVGPDDQETKTICIVDVALHDARGALVGSLRGRASGASTTGNDVLDAAARSAVTRLPEALRMAEQVAHGQSASASQTYARR
ncbi:MAG TPA: hypothetical protein VH062_04860 [Polyangiaceae bacterium]|jgi:hypothetical protein|nr:hypothetical protein [Polyangiaceae bacterium]